MNNSIRIQIETITDKEQRYEKTCGDWFKKNGTLYIKVIKSGNCDWDFLVALHELIEAWLCIKRGITDEIVTNFDVSFTQQNAEGEPGDAPDCPYRKEHFFATNIERIVAAELDINWQEYDKGIIVDGTIAGND